jgi:hypothetical protein
MTTVGLAVGEIEDVAEDAAHRRARGVQDPQRLVWCGHVQHPPLPRQTAMRMSPGTTGAAMEQLAAVYAPGMGQPSGKS